ncbi:unnamed protein product [Dovyalis caffra]|uniref:Uncharacterized protein n=1 Tax=Dovyalis caffra TaxID=77055 RepID=A0AAV1RK00_9ROSI|nr:unnamed protein product [Dovyalis caffra]
MASIQCCKPVEKPCNQGQQNHSLSQKVSDLASRALKREDAPSGQTTAKSQTQCHGQKQAEGGGFKTTGTHCSTQTQSHGPNGKCFGGTTNGMTPGCDAKTNRRSERKKKSLLQRIKDGISGHSDGSSSESESDSDDKKCGKRKAKKKSERLGLTGVDKLEDPIKTIPGQSSESSDTFDIAMTRFCDAFSKAFA